MRNYGEVEERLKGDVKTETTKSDAVTSLEWEWVFHECKINSNTKKA